LSSKASDAARLGVGTPAGAFGRTREFRSSADVLNRDQAPGALYTLINKLSEISILPRTLDGLRTAKQPCKRALMVEPNMSLHGD
jgi:hypothetical protein